jgi:hypothetical protein
MDAGWWEPLAAGWVGAGKFEPVLAGVATGAALAMEQLLVKGFEMIRNGA